MNNWPSDLLTELTQKPTKLCRLFVLTPVIGSAIRFTDHDRDITVGGNLYPTNNAFQPSAIENSISGANQNLEVSILCRDDLVSYADLYAGLYNGARMDVYVASWGNPSAGKGLYSSGLVGSISLPSRLYATLSIIGGSGRMTRQLTEVYQPTCRASFCDTRCGLDIDDFGRTFTIDSVSDSMQFTQDIDSRGADGFYTLGSLTWLTGDSAGQTQEVSKSLATGVVTLFYPPRYPMQAGDTGRIYQGCALTLAACVAYDNRANFRGEPFVPGDDYKAIT